MNKREEQKMGWGERKKEKKQKNTERKGMWFVQHYIKSQIVFTLLFMHGSIKQRTAHYVNKTALEWLVGIFYFSPFFIYCFPLLAVYAKLTPALY